MKKVIAKFECTSACKNAEYPEITDVDLAAAIDGEENQTWAYYTPSGNIDMNIKSDVPAGTFFKEGKNYKVTFEEMEDGE